MVKHTFFNLPDIRYRGAALLLALFFFLGLVLGI